MDLQLLIPTSTGSWLLLSLLIFFARIIDVSLGTLRIIFLSRGKRFLAPVLGFFEVLIWIIVISQLVQSLTHPITYIAYAAGFAMGNFIGMSIENRLALGMLAVRIISHEDTTDLSDRLQAAGFGVTYIDAVGATGRVKIIYSIIKRKSLPEVVKIIQEVNPKAFFSVEEIRSAYEGIFPSTKSSLPWDSLMKRR